MTQEEKLGEDVRTQEDTQKMEAALNSTQLDMVCIAHYRIVEVITPLLINNAVFVAGTQWGASAYHPTTRHGM